MTISSDQRRATRQNLVNPRPETLLGYHLRTQGQRLDHLAARYLDDATAWRRICELNDVMLPEALSEVAEIAIPRKRRERG